MCNTNLAMVWMDVWVGIGLDNAQTIAKTGGQNPIKRNIKKIRKQAGLSRATLEISSEFSSN